jgi:hypothetical protein
MKQLPNALRIARRPLIYLVGSWNFLSFIAKGFYAFSFEKIRCSERFHARTLAGFKDFVDF